MSRLTEKAEFKNYKFKELKVYASTEWLANNQKKYRQVFDRYEVSYIYAELSVFNKKFDIENWEVQVELKCFELRKNKSKVCSLEIKKQISKYDHIIYIREGWGNKKEGAFWKAGTFLWEAWVEGEKVASKYFYVEDPGNHADGVQQKYVELSSLKLYEGQYDDVNKDDRNYLKAFSSEETRYIYAEINLKNLFRSRDWHCELFVKFYNQARELKGQVTKLNTVKNTDEIIAISAGWGTNVKGSWRYGNYTMEIVFMDSLLAVMPFEVQDEFEEGVSAVQLPNRKSPVLLVPDANLNQSFDEVMGRLDNLIGLSMIKKQVRDHSKYIQFLQLRREKGFDESEDINVHSVFMGNPGTGKTTVAQMMGALYKKMGLLSKGHVFEVDRVDLVGEYIGQTAPKVKEALKKARGGVLFIDEAYALARTNDDSKDFGREVIEMLVKEMSNGQGDLVIIVAGYPKEMKHFIDSNPGFKSRFKLFYHFRDYLPQELSAITDFMCHRMEVRLTPEAKIKVDEQIIEAYRNRDRSFGNARFVHDLIEKAKINLGLRAMNDKDPQALEKDHLETILLEDINKIKLNPTPDVPEIPIDYKLLELATTELNSLIGMLEVKRQILDLVDIVRYYRESEKDVLHKFFLHTVFIGNPGTGKTTVARILTKIYKALGILERGHMVETDRQGLVAGFIGQTAIKTAEKVDESIGGVLFIDEAYALANYNSGYHGDYGNEAIQTLLKRMEDHRGQFFVFVAGYPDNMDQFLKTNPGLRSRFDKILKFEDYEPSELLEIANKMILDEGLEITKKAKDTMKTYLGDLYLKRDKFFGNARAIRRIITEIIKIQNLRLASMKKESRSQIPINQIVAQDIRAAFKKFADGSFQKLRIGFKRDN